MARLRKTVEADLPALPRLFRRSWLVSWAPELPFEAVQEFAAKDPARAHAQECWHLYTVAIADNELVGASRVAGDCVEDLFVDPKTWNKGIGTALMDGAEREIAQNHAVARLEVRSFNERARRFYKRRGWQEVRFYPGTEVGFPVENVEMTKAVAVSTPPADAESGEQPR